VCVCARVCVSWIWQVLNVAMALKVYRHLGDAGMVMALEQLLDIEDRNLLAGHISMLFADYGQVCIEWEGQIVKNRAFVWGSARRGQRVG
jgi:hypothetical protein